MSNKIQSCYLHFPACACIRPPHSSLHVAAVVVRLWGYFWFVEKRCKSALVWPPTSFVDRVRDIGPKWRLKQLNYDGVFEDAMSFKVLLINTVISDWTKHITFLLFFKSVIHIKEKKRRLSSCLKSFPRHYLLFCRELLLIPTSLCTDLAQGELPLWYKIIGYNILHNVLSISTFIFQSCFQVQWTVNIKTAQAPSTRKVCGY